MTDRLKEGQMGRHGNIQTERGTGVETDKPNI